MQAYSRQRENKQEAYFNLGRAAHQLGLLHLAVPWYYRALAAPVPEPYQGAGSLLTGITFPPHHLQILRYCHAVLSDLEA